MIKFVRLTVIFTKNYLTSLWLQELEFDIHVGHFGIGN